MTKFRLSSKFRLFLIISVALIVIGMTIGTVGHFVLNGFFNYGDEFAPYKSVVVRYNVAEHPDPDETVKAVCEKEFSGLGVYSVSESDSRYGKQLEYKFSAKSDMAKLEAAALRITNAINTVSGEDAAQLNVATAYEGHALAGGSRALTFASIALASGAAFMFLYYVVRYKMRSGCTALLACLHNLGIFVALAALTRLPIGAEFIALSALLVFSTMLGCGVFFDRARKNFKSESFAKSERAEVIEVSAQETFKLNVFVAIALVAFVLVFGVFAAIAAMNIAAFAIVPLVVIFALTLCYGTLFFVPSLHVKIDALFEKIKQRLKAKKAEGKNKTAVSGKAQA